MLSEAVEDELLDANPVMALRKHRRSKLKQANACRIEPLTAEELTTLLDTARTHTVERGGKTVHPFRDVYPFLLLLARTGLRLGEALALQWGDLDWRGKFLRVRRAHVRGEISLPKSGKPRDVDLTDQLLATLRTLYRGRFERVAAIDLAQQAALDAEKATALDSWVFPDSHGGLLDEHNLRPRVWAPLLAAAGIRHVRLHDLRHTHASHLIGKGVELQYVQQQLGHHSPAFTLTVYGHLLPKDRRGLVNQLDEPAPAGTLWAPVDETPVSPSPPEKTKPLVVQGVS